MAHYARVNQDNIVTYVARVSNDIIVDINGVEHEEWAYGHLYQTIPDSMGDDWVQTSYNDNFRVRYAGVGYTYDRTLDAFIPPKPFDSWSLDNQTFDWVSPLGNHPPLTEEQVVSGFYYRWDENAYLADNTTGWVLDNYFTPNP